MASFQARIGWEKPRNSENENYHSDHFLPDPEQRISKKQQKIKKTQLWFLFNQNRFGKTEKERK